MQRPYKAIVQEAAEILGRHRVTIQTWARKYREGGILNLMEKPQEEKPKGRPRKTLQWLEKALEKRLQNPEGFTSYQEMVD
ncbi:MAG: hypothetical protein AAGA60_32410 [Cyanobacteria bacterium P01_E01_bin.42]